MVALAGSVEFQSLDSNPGSLAPEQGILLCKGLNLGQVHCEDQGGLGALTLLLPVLELSS